MGHITLKIKNTYCYKKSSYNFATIIATNLRMHTQVESKVPSEDILYLNSPLLIINTQIRNQPSLLSALQNDVQQGLLNLNLKPVLKIDKKIKKNDKDDDREIDRTGVKLKLKKKTRSKISFDDDFESVTDLFEKTDTDINLSPLPLARPTKAPLKDADEVSFTIKQKSLINIASKKKKSNTNQTKKDFQITSIEKPTTISLGQPKTVQELAEIFLVSTTDIIKSLFLKGISVTVNQVIDLATAQKLGQEFGIEVNFNSDQSLTDKKRLDLSSSIKSNLVSRSPIITVMGHVDHGKTTLLDKIRKTQVAKKEAGGITQKIGAYEVNVLHKNEARRLIFLDTPGHAAFSGMRSRGVSITDIVVLVVAADDGVKPQTLEAIQQIKASNVPIIVAINKIDKQDANVDSIKEELAKHNLISEDWGGDTLMVPISAMQGTNLDTLLEMILLLAEMLELKADPSAPAEGTVLESNLDRTRGAVASVLIQNGTLKIGDILYLGGSISKVRGMINSLGDVTRTAGPSSPVFLWGLTKVPTVGDYFNSFKDEKDARIFASSEESVSRSGLVSSQQLSENYTVSDSESKSKINLIIKTDTQGSAEAITSSLHKINDSKVQIRVLYACAGEITETDVEFASASSATLIAFNTTSASGALKTAKNVSVNITYFDVIYDLFDFVQTMIDTLVGPQFEEKFMGSAVIKTVFPLAKSFVAGSSVIEGKITKSSFIHIIRNNEVVHKGFIDSIKRLKETVSEVSEGSECGIFLKEFDSWKEGDIVKSFDLIPKKRDIL